MKLPAHILFFSLMVIAKFSVAQQRPGNFAIGLNPLGLAESQMYIGYNLSYSVSKKYGAWTELSAIVNNNNMPNYWTNMKGYRLLN